MHTDILDNSPWLRWLPDQAKPYAKLMRLDRPIGTWLLLWPCWWSLALADEGFPDLWLYLLFAVGALLMRGAGCAINDLYDQDIDALVERTRARPLVDGSLTPRQAILFIIGLLAVSFLLLLCLNTTTIWLGVASLLLVFTYPLAKRVTYWPQLVLGMAFNWGALMGSSAILGFVSFPSILLYFAGIAWTLGYDTIYAHQDKRDDELIGVKSLALRLGDQSRAWIFGFYMTCLLLINLAGLASGFGAAFYILMLGGMAHFLWQVGSWQMDDPANCLLRFRSNRYFGLIVFSAILAGKIFS